MSVAIVHMPSQCISTSCQGLFDNDDRDFKGVLTITILSLDLLSDGDSVYTRENLYEQLGTPVKTYLICRLLCKLV